MDELSPTLRGGEQADADLQDQRTDAETQGEGAGEQQPAADSAGQQQRAFNAAMAAARRRAERDTEERMRRQTDDDIAAMRIPNPQKPGSYFSSKKELEEYSGALRRADAEKRARAENRSVDEVLEDEADKAFVRAQRTQAKKAQEASAAKAARDRFVQADVEDMQRRHPDVDIAALDLNPAFRRFVGSRYGKEHLADLYEDFVALAGATAASATARSSDRQARSTGHGGGGAAGALTAAQRAELKRWNEENPGMKMSEKEFLER